MKSLSLTKPHLIIMVGLPGSGKSFFAEKFAETFHVPYICQHKIEELSTKNGEALAKLQLAELLKTNQPILFEGATGSRPERVALFKAARMAGYEPLIIWVQVDQFTAQDRSIAAKKTTSPEEFNQHSKHFTPPSSVEKPLVISGKHTYASQAKVVLKKLSSPRAEISTQAAAPERTVQSGRRSITIR